MSENQFKKILESEEPRYIAGIPVVIESYALLQDRKTGEVSAQIIFCNISEQRIRELVVDIICKDAEGKKTQGISQYSYSELMNSRDQEFGEGDLIKMPDAGTRGIEVGIRKAVYLDGSEFVSGAKSMVIPVQQRIVDYFDDDRIAEQYVRETNNAASFIAVEFDDVWICSCGAYNNKNEQSCHACMLGREGQKKFLSAKILEPKLVAYELEQVELAKQKAEEKRLQNLKAAKTRKLIKILVPVGVLILAFVAIWVAVVIPSNKYNDAMDMLAEGEYGDATVAFNELDNYKDSKRMYQYLNEKRLLIMYGLASGYEEEMSFDDIRLIRSEGGHYSIGLVEASNGTAGLRTNGTAFVSAIEVDVSEWEDVIDVSAGFMHMVGLRADGTVAVEGRHHDVSQWRDIISVEAGADHTVGLRSDGSVVAAGKNDEGQCDVQEWRDIVAIYTNGYATIGLKSDGSVVATGMNQNGEINVEEWQDIIAISTNGNFTLGLMSDGSVVAVGENSDGQCDTGEWSDIVAISAGGRYSVGLRSDGSVVATGLNDKGQCNVGDWSDIVMVSAGRHHVVGLRTDGSVVAAGSNDYGQSNVVDWDYIVAVDAGEFHTVAIQSDGKIVAVGKNDKGECAVFGIDLW